MSHKSIIFIICILLCAWAANAEIYSWTDENGVKHYSNVPPAEAENVKIEFKEYQYDPKTETRRLETEQKQLDALIKEIDEENESAQAEEKKRAEEAMRNQPAGRGERIEAERKRLEAKIAELEAKPLEYFGSSKNKRTRIGFYKYRLETLMHNPDKYYNEPVGFEGNVKPEENDSPTY